MNLPNPPPVQLMYDYISKDHFPSLWLERRRSEGTIWCPLPALHRERCADGVIGPAEKGVCRPVKGRELIIVVKETRVKPCISHLGFQSGDQIFPPVFLCTGASALMFDCSGSVSVFLKQFLIEFLVKMAWIVEELKLSETNIKNNNINKTFSSDCQYESHAIHLASFWQKAFSFLSSLDFTDGVINIHHGWRSERCGSGKWWRQSALKHHRRRAGRRSRHELQTETTKTMTAAAKEFWTDWTVFPRRKRSVRATLKAFLARAALNPFAPNWLWWHMANVVQ